MKRFLANRGQLGLLGILLVFLVLALVKMRGGSGGAGTALAPGTRPPGAEDRPAAARPRAGRGDKQVNPDDIAFFSTRDLDVAKARAVPGERNLFDPRAASPTPLPTPTPAPPPPPAPGEAVFVGPLLPPGPTPTPRPPEISFKFLGTFGPRERPIAVLALGTDTINAREGEVVFQHFIIRKIGYESIDVGFIGPWKDTRRVGLTQ